MACPQRPAASGLASQASAALEIQKNSALE
jgi:hypothetical protein